MFRYEDVEGAVASGEISEAMVVAEGEERTTWFVWLLVACTSISGLLFGAYAIVFPRTQSLNTLPRLRHGCDIRSAGDNRR